jgi:hypothetical protein
MNTNQIRTRFATACTRISKFPAIALFAIAVSSAHAGTYSVSKSGKDTNPGTAAQPWLTIQRAVSSAGPGDLIMVGGGTYREFVRTHRSGAPNQYISIVGTNGTLVTGFDVRHSYVELRGFNIDGPNTSFAVIVNPGANHVRVMNNVFTNVPDRSLQLSWQLPSPTHLWAEGNTFMGAANVAVGLMGQHHVLTNNLFIMDPDGPSRGTGDALIVLASDTTIIGNTFTNWSRPTGSTAHIDIIQAFTTGTGGRVISSNVVFEGNLIVNCRGTQIGMIEDQENLGKLSNWIFRNNVYSHVDGVINIYAPNFSFYNNTFYKSGINSGSPLLFRSAPKKGSAHGGKVFNNIFYQCGSQPHNSTAGYYGVDTGVLSLEADYNLVIGEGTGQFKTAFATNGREQNGLNGFDPQFSSPAVAWSSLLETSPCRGAGRSFASLFTTSFDGHPRLDLWDIGAKQSVGAKRPEIPANLRIVPPAQSVATTD